jgi:hypothetical protein
MSRPIVICEDCKEMPARHIFLLEDLKKVYVCDKCLMIREKKENEK